MDPMSAQRLSASQRWAFGIGRGSAAGIATCSTPFGITEVGMTMRAVAMPRRSCVLNAFRHHRGGHHWRPSIADRDSMCSTPFGITEVGITSAVARSIATRRVLNAFRHHRGGHTASPGTCSTVRWCSTPFGITEVGISHLRHESSAAIECSTPFGITEVGIRRHPAASRLYRCAQRLSASQRWACNIDLAARSA